MTWKMFRPAPQTSAIITQSQLKTDGTPGKVEIPGIVSLDIKDSHLMGKDAAGNVRVITPLSQVALAIVDDIQRESK